MGIVPWVSKSELPSPVPILVSEDMTTLSEAVTAQIPQVNVDIAATVAALPAEVTSKHPAYVTGPMPSSVEELKVWLPSQPLGVLAVRSNHQAFIGQAEAPLLVVVESADSKDSVQSPPTTPFNAEAAQLFDLMMRAMKVTLGQRKLCYLPGGTDAASASESARVLDLCVPQTRAILLMVKDWNTLADPVTDHFRLDQPALPVWRIPHPNLLLEFNQLKRQAWTSLQALQSTLS
jgi:hypothetical protein